MIQTDLNFVLFVEERKSERPAQRSLWLGSEAEIRCAWWPVFHRRLKSRWNIDPV